MKTETKKVMKKADPQQSHASKLDQIKTGKKNVRTTGGSEQKKIVITGKDGSKIIQNQTETKTEETAVLRKKRNYVMYEAKLGTETTTDITKIDAPKKKEKPILRAPEPRIEEKIVQTKKKKEYLDNYQYHETKDLKKSKPDTVIHQRWGDIFGGSFEETSYKKVTFHQRGGSVDQNRGAKKPSSIKPNKSTSNLRNKPQKSASATKTLETTTKVGRRGGAGGKTSTTTTTKKETKTTTTTNRGGDRQTKTSTKTTTTRGRK